MSGCGPNAHKKNERGDNPSDKFKKMFCAVRGKIIALRRDVFLEEKILLVHILSDSCMSFDDGAFSSEERTGEAAIGLSI